ncbi:MAG: hypothetical protein ACHQSE_13335, partial [Gemmatimonadales bacterium]
MQTITDIHFEFDVPVSADQAFEAIGRPKDWWIRDTEGNASAPGASFTVYFNRAQDFVRFTVTEAQPGRRIAWHVDDCYLQWFADKHEWTGTDVIFEIVPSPAGSAINFVHRGVGPEAECYS